MKNLFLDGNKGQWNDHWAKIGKTSALPQLFRL